jgi:hypothetical protein
MRRLRRVIVVGGLLAATAATPASGATNIGQTFIPTLSCSPNITFLQTTSVANAYEAPSAGVITEWSFLADNNPAVIKLKVARNTTGNEFRIIGSSSLETPTANQLNTYSDSDVRIPVIQGDLIGLYNSIDGRNCGRRLDGFDFHFLNAADPGPGTTSTYTPGGSGQLNIAAVLEPDADKDEFGDESQDNCPTDPQTQGQCQGGGGNDNDPPETTITKDPPDTSGKNKVKFKFTSSEARSKFECKFDKEGWTSCASPEKERVDEGKHKFKVRAIDQAGNVDPTPDKDKFKVN